MFLLARCPHCRKRKITVQHPDKGARRIRTHKLRDPALPLGQLALMPRCPGSLSMVALNETVTL